MTSRIRPSRIAAQSPGSRERGSDGAAGLIAAIEHVFPRALRQRCLVHRARNILAKVPAGIQPEIKDAFWALFDIEELKTRPGPRLVELVNHRIAAMAERYAPTYPAAIAPVIFTPDSGAASTPSEAAD